MDKLGVMQLVDTLASGGLERVAVNLANLLPRDQYATHLGTTRAGGSLEKLLDADVGRINLTRMYRFDLSALLRLSGYCRTHNIRIIHAHGTALFVAATASLLPPFPKVIWHDHYGAYATVDRPIGVYRWPVKRAAHVIVVNSNLERWVVDKLDVRAERVSYLPNFVDFEIQPPARNLPGMPGKRIVCLANLRRQKDHVNLLRAMALLVVDHADASLLLVGAPSDADYLREIETEIQRLHLGTYVHLLGPREDVAAVLAGCSLGVISSASEGLPLALLEYGAAGLPAVATDVGQCAEVLDNGRAGLLIPSGDSQALATALLRLLNSPSERDVFAGRLQDYVAANFSPMAAIGRVCKIYEKILQ